MGNGNLVDCGMHMFPPYLRGGGSSRLSRDPDSATHLGATCRRLE